MVNLGNKSIKSLIELLREVPDKLLANEKAWWSNVVDAELEGGCEMFVDDEDVRSERINEEGWGLMAEWRENDEIDNENKNEVKNGRAWMINNNVRKIERAKKWTNR